MGAVHGTHAVHLAAALALTACVGTAPPTPIVPELRIGLAPVLPDTSGWGVHVLALRRAPDGAVWVGTYGAGLFVLPPRKEEWEHHPPTSDSTGVSSGFVNSIAIERDSLTVWYGTVGNGFGVSRDRGRTWRNWTQRQLGPEWQYVVPEGITVRGDTVYIATADGLRRTSDRGATWRCIQAAAPPAASGTAERNDGCTERIRSLPNDYLLAMDVGPDGSIWVGHLRGLSISRDGGRTWRDVGTAGIAGERIRAIRFAPDSAVWVASESRLFVDSARTGAFRAADIRVPGYPSLPGAPRAIIGSPGLLPPAIATSYGLVARTTEGGYRIFYVAAADRYRPAGDVWAVMWWGPPWTLLGGSASGLSRVLAGEAPVTNVIDTLPPVEPQAARHVWFQRPMTAADGNPYIDATYRYGSTMGGGLQQHQGIEFNNPAGTPVRAIGDGVVVFAGAAEQGSNTIAIRHDRQWEAQYVFSTYYHNSSLEAHPGQRVRAGDVIARVGHTGRATNEHLHLEVHVAPAQDSAAIVHPDQRFPPHTVNPQLWVEPLAGTGIVAGRVLDAAGQPAPGTRVYGLVLPYPEETPYSFAETYGDRARGSPAYGEHFAVGDVPAGVYMLGVKLGGKRVWRRVRVQPGMVSWVEFRP
jgi:murein DD-endopeptidase MepM/ murein hydrolase activator NlpD